MSGFMGMDTSQVDDFGNLLTQRRETVDQRFQDLKGTVDSIVGSQWIGPDADSFQSQYQSEVITKVTAAVDRMQQLFDEIRQHIEEQDTTSTADDAGGLLDDVLDALGGFFSAAGDFLSEVWNNFLDRLGISGVDAAGGIISTVHSFAKRFGEFAFGKGSVPKIIPVVGDIFTGVMAGVDRWNSEPDRPFWERLGRAALDGGANFAGSLLGSYLGGSAGAAAGGALGGLIGGGGGAVAGAPAGGVGAVPGAAAGGGGGAAVGAVVGGIVGDVVGSYIFSTAADSVIDAILD